MQLCNVILCTVIIKHCSFADVTDNDTAAEGTVRLVGGASPLEGRVEVFLLGQWGTVCNSYWEFVDARVVCLELGYLRAVGAPVSATYGAGSGPSWYSNVRCRGTEMNLTECSKIISLSGSACSQTQYAGAVCSGVSYICIGFCLQTYYIVVYLETHPRDGDLHKNTTTTIY